MIDTTFLTHAMQRRLSDNDLLRIGASHPRGLTQWVINPRAGEPYPSLTFQTQPNGIQYLTARQSLPRMRYGHNATLLGSHMDIYAGLGLLSDAIRKRTGVDFNPLTATVTGVHFTRDVHVGLDLVTPTLTNLEVRQLPRFKRIRFDHGVEYKQKSSSFQIYSKYHEIQAQVMRRAISNECQSDALRAAEGVIRIEARLGIVSLIRLQKRLNITRQAKDMLTPKLSKYIVDDFTDKIQFERAAGDAEPTAALERLMEVYGSRVAMRLYGFLAMHYSYGKDFWKIESLNYSRNTYFNNLRLCRSAGVWSN